MNEDRTSPKSGAKLTPTRSGPVLYELVSREGDVSAVKFTSALGAGEYARRMWPDQEQDEDRTGKGWDVQVVGS